MWQRTQLKSQTAIRWWEGSLAEIGYFGNTAEKYRNRGSLGYKYAPRPFTRLLGLGLMTNLRSGGAMLRAGTQSYNDRKKCNVEDQPVATQNLVVGITDTTGSPLATAGSAWCHSCWWWRR